MQSNTKVDLTNDVPFQLRINESLVNFEANVVIQPDSDAPYLVAITKDGEHPEYQRVSGVFRDSVLNRDGNFMLNNIVLKKLKNDVSLDVFMQIFDLDAETAAAPVPTAPAHAPAAHAHAPAAGAPVHAHAAGAETAVAAAAPAAASLENGIKQSKTSKFVTKYKKIILGGLASIVGLIVALIFIDIPILNKIPGLSSIKKMMKKTPQSNIDDTKLPSLPSSTPPLPSTTTSTSSLPPLPSTTTSTSSLPPLSPLPTTTTTLDIPSISTDSSTTTTLEVPCKDGVCSIQPKKPINKWI